MLCGSFYSDTVIKLKVKVFGSHPHIHGEVTESRQMQVVCKSEGWFPQPKVLFLNKSFFEVEVTFDIDTNGTFKVFAGDKTTGKENKIIITNHKNHLAKEDSEHMIQEAEKYKPEEEKQWDKASSKNPLKLFAINIKATAKNEKLQVQLNDEGKQIILNKCNEIINSFHKNQTAEKEEFEHQQKKLEKVCSPMIPKLSQSRR
ncbi:PREDICTED: heat shock cognate 71 kDa protein-like [Myotis brandtii]|uniref:heat shock cognate 71 kDa protein-like n=1 Tax=Myotis brandtii TaxID=109478 RepID=UPI000703E0EC|nr:PREDICTED: heat shock cognate 71 kDa protein-like [Myotis brandtii]